MEELTDMIKSRKSVRTFDGRLLSEEHSRAIAEYIKKIKNPFNIPVEFVLLNAEEHRLSSPVLSGEQMYVAGKVEKRPYADVAADLVYLKLYEAVADLSGMSKEYHEFVTAYPADTVIIPEYFFEGVNYLDKRLKQHIDRILRCYRFLHNTSDKRLSEHM